MIVGCPGIVNRPEEVIRAVPFEDVGSLAIGIVFQGSSAWSHQCHGGFVDARHVVVQLSTCHIAVAPVEIALPRVGIGEDIDVYLLSVSLTFRPFIDNRMPQVLERTCRRVCHRHTYRLPMSGLPAVIEEIPVLPINHLLLDGRSPCVAACPLRVARQVEVDALVLPVNQVGTGETGEIPSSPSRRSVGGGVDIITVCQMRIHHFGVGMVPHEDGIAAVRLCQCAHAGQHEHGEGEDDSFHIYCC